MVVIMVLITTTAIRITKTKVVIMKISNDHDIVMIIDQVGNSRILVASWQAEPSGIWAAFKAWGFRDVQGLRLWVEGCAGLDEDGQRPCLQHCGVLLLRLEPVRLHDDHAKALENLQLV